MSEPDGAPRVSPPVSVPRWPPPPGCPCSARSRRLPFAGPRGREGLSWARDRPDTRTHRKDITVTETASPALRTALAYYRAWTSHRLEEAMSYVAGDIVCDAPAGRLEGADAYRDFMGPFVEILTGSTLIAAFGDDITALIMYDTQTVPVASAPGAECLTVTDGKITYSRFIFDRLPFDAARRAGPA